MFFSKRQSKQIPAVSGQTRAVLSSNPVFFRINQVRCRKKISFFFGQIQTVLGPIPAVFGQIQAVLGLVHAVLGKIQAVLGQIQPV